MLKRVFENPANIIRAGFVCLPIALVFNIRGRQWLSGSISEDRLDTIGGLLYGVAFGLLVLGMRRRWRARTGDENRHSR